jgi:hypothetical protein
MIDTVKNVVHKIRHEIPRDIPPPSSPKARFLTDRKPKIITSP